jgi:Fe2+ or Zn2+ uptake regulation protein
LTEHPRHGWSLDELLGELHSARVSADFSTVFRALGLEPVEGAVRRVDLGDGKARYEANNAHHEHIRCNNCGTVSEVPGCLVQGSTQLVEATTGFSITDHRLVFSGLCPTCKSA